MNLKYTTLGLFVLILLFPNVNAIQTIYELQGQNTTNMNDTYVQDGGASANNFGLLPDLEIGLSGNRFVYIMFNLSGYNNAGNCTGGDTELQNANLTFYVSYFFNATDPLVPTQLAINEFHNWSWDEKIVTYDKKPGGTTNITIDTIIISKPNRGEWMAGFNVTSWTKECLANNESCSYIINMTEDSYASNAIYFVSKDNTTNIILRPKLILTCGTDPTSQRNFLCNSTTSGHEICGGVDGRYLYNCTKFTDSSYQWDFENIEFCDYGCWWNEDIYRYQCKNVSETTTDKCYRGISMCSVDGHWTYNCTLVNNRYDWSDEGDNKTYCEFGCVLGQCTNISSNCVLGDSMCMGNTIYYCGDFNGDSRYEFSEYNSTFCTYGCIETWDSATNSVNATCNWHSYDEIHAIRNQMTYLGDTFDYIAYSPNLKMALWLILSFIITAFIAFGTRDWESNNKEIILFTIILTVIFGIWITWLPWVAGIIILILGGLIYVYGKQGIE